MLAPVDKVLNRGNDIFQIVITRKCDIFNCSECTQLLPFRKDPLEMTLECIEEALACIQGWPGVIACFGGNPCSHSRFPEVCKLWQKYVPNQRQRGLWTNNLMTHGAICRETFWPNGRFNLNVHGSTRAKADMNSWLPGIKVYGEKPSQHGGQLLDYADYGISEERWTELRETCDINQKWSGACYGRLDESGVMQPYMYFCERAGALDGVRGTNHGVLMQPGCWRWAMDRFQGQVSACCDHYCGVPLRTKGYLDSEYTYGVSPSLVPLTMEFKGKVRVETRNELPQSTHELTDYQGLRK